jgi:succinate-semialdehyde dehydrogenase/glutarate-semialdehyde dehydrogenase
MSTATQEQTVVDGVEKRLYIGGEWRDASAGGTLTVEDPATGEALCQIADGSGEDAKAALDAAVAGQAEWAATPPNERGEILWRAFELLNQRADELALLMTLEMGKTVTESKAESPTRRSSSAGSRARRCESAATTRWRATPSAGCW